MNAINILFLCMLGFVPGSIWASSTHQSPLTIFILSGLAIIPLAAWIGNATEEIAEVVGPTFGGILNATMGNATELIIAIIALRAGLIDVVKASLAGSIISNLLLVMGLSMLLGGIRHKEQTFSVKMAQANSSALTLAAVAILLPTIISFSGPQLEVENISLVTSGILIVIYGLSLLFCAKNGKTEPLPIYLEGSEEQPPKVKTNMWLWTGVLIASTLVVALESEYLVDSLELATESLHLTFLFTGVILIPILGNAAEHMTAVTMAMKNKMDLSVSVAVGSSMQIALFVAPVCVITAHFLGQSMGLDFGTLELMAIAVSVVLANSISSDGNSNWFEGSLLLATYGILGTAFFFQV